MSRTWNAQVSPNSRFIVVPVFLTGPMKRSRQVSLILDTGSPVTILSTDLASAIDVTATTGDSISRLIGPTGPQDGYRTRLPSLTAMGCTLLDFPVHCHDLEPGLEVDGVLGLDVIRRGDLHVNLPGGSISFTWTK